MYRSPRIPHEQTRAEIQTDHDHPQSALEIAQGAGALAVMLIAAIWASSTVLPSPPVVTQGDSSTVTWIDEEEAQEQLIEAGLTRFSFRFFSDWTDSSGYMRVNPESQSGFEVQSASVPLFIIEMAKRRERQAK
jgi:hypothetical protein